MNKIIKIVILLETAFLVVLLLILLLFPKSESTAGVCFENDCFLVEIADTMLEHQRGLMYRENLEKNRGMLFVFQEEGNYPFWMKNTLIPLDIIWISQEKAIVFIKENAQPCPEACNAIDSQQTARYALEVNGGVSSQIGLKIGDQAQILR